LPGATLAPGSTHTVELTVRATGAPAGLQWTAVASGPFACGVSPASGLVVVPANGAATVDLAVSLPADAFGTASLSVELVFDAGGGRAAKVTSAIQAATGGRPEVKPVPSTWSAAAGASGAVSFQVHSLIGSSEEVVLTAGRFNPDPNNVGAHFAWGAAPASVIVPGGGTVTVSIPVTLPTNAYGGNLNAAQLSVTSAGGISNATGNALVSVSSPGGLPTALVPVGLTPTSSPVTGRDGPAALPLRGYWLVPGGLEGVRVIRSLSTDSIGELDANGDGGDDRIVGTIRVPSYAAAISVLPGFVTAFGETLDVGLLAAGRAGLMLVDLRVIEDPTFGSWEDFFDTDMNGVDDRILRTIPTPGFATDAAWFRAPSGRVVVLVADADTGSVPVAADYDPAAAAPGTGAGVIAVDVAAALDSLGGVPYASGTLATPGTALDLEVRGGSSVELAVADGSGGVALYGLSASGGAPAVVSFAALGTVALSSAWGAPVARDAAWISNTRDSVYLAVAAAAGGAQIVRAPRGGAPSLILSQQTAAPAVGIAGTWTGTLGVAMRSGGVALMRAPSAAELNKIAPGAAAPYTAPVLLARGAPWTSGGALEQAAHQSAMSAATSLCFEPTAGPIPDLLVSDGGRILVLRPGSAAITAVVVEPTPPDRVVWVMRAMPNPTAGESTIELRLEPGDSSTLPAGASLGTVEIAIVDVRGGIVRRLRAQGAGPVARVAWDGRDGAGRPAASGHYWARVLGLSRERAPVAPIVIVR
jgi:hypothetical protein